MPSGAGMRVALGRIVATPHHITYKKENYFVNTHRTQLVSSLVSSLALGRARFAVQIPVALGLIGALSAAATARAQTVTSSSNVVEAAGGCGSGDEWDGRECFPKCT